jgi:dipeptidyl aminopeptidase/acylaminoacyl peptidase
VKSLCGFLFALPLLAAPPFTIEQVLGTPFPYAMMASPGGESVAWVQDASGVRNIWMARAPDFQATQLTQFSSDDGQELGDISWDLKGTAFAFTRGEGPNGQGEIPNPRNNPAGTRQEIWLVAPDSKPRRIGDGNSPAITPDGSVVVWLHSGQIWSTGGPLLSARGSAHNLTWSPDGTRFAFSSDRTDHALIGVYDRTQKTLRYLDPSVDTDRSPAWSPDGKSVAFIRIPASRDAGTYGAKRTGQPWSIRVVDLETGKGREVWHAQEGPGSVFWPLAGNDQLRWTSGGNIVFPWERDGWQHLYSVPSKSGTAILLTPGAFEADNVTITPDHKSIVFSSNQGDIDRRHLWQVAVDGGTPAPLTSGSGIEWSPASLSGGRIAFLHSDKSPARAALLESGSVRDFSALPPQTLDQPQQVIFAAPDGMQVHGQLFLPPNGGPGKHPAVVFFHGGSRRQMLLGWHPMQYYNQAYGFNQYLASRGYVVLSVNYRSGIGYGTEFREALRFGPTGASEFNDVLGAAKYLQTRPDVDSTRIGAWGGSYGGYLTAMALARASNLFAAGVDLHGIYDWNLEFSESATTPEFKRLARESSPIAAIATWKSPVLLIQGDDDRNVAFSQTVQNVEALRKQGVPFEQIVFPDEVHEFLLHADWLTAYHAADEFLARYLKP